MKLKCRNLIRKTEGQIVLILVLITIVGLTVGLSLISRTVTDVRISSQIEQSNRAFSAAEAGVEIALKSAVVNGPTVTFNLSQVAVTYKVSTVGDSNVYTFPNAQTGKTQVLWLADHDSDGNIVESSTYPVGSPLDVCWGSTVNNNAAVVMSLLYKTIDNNYKIAKSAYDPDPAAPGHDIYNFLTLLPEDMIGGYCNGNYRFKKTINDVLQFWEGLTLTPDTKLISLWLQPVDQDTSFAINTRTGTNLYKQGIQINSQGLTSTGILRRIKVIKSFQLIPQVFNYTLFSD